MGEVSGEIFTQLRHTKNRGARPSIILLPHPLEYPCPVKSRQNEYRDPNQGGGTEEQPLRCAPSKASERLVLLCQADGNVAASSYRYHCGEGSPEYFYGQRVAVQIGNSDWLRQVSRHVSTALFVVSW